MREVVIDVTGRSYDQMTEELWQASDEFDLDADTFVFKGKSDDLMVLSAIIELTRLYPHWRVDWSE